MKTKNKQELQVIAGQVFARYKTAKKVALTSDGMAFIVDESENAVKNHSKNNRYKKELTITYFTRDEIEGETTNVGTKTAEELINEIGAAETADAVNAILEAETKGKKRKTVLEAGVKRIEELKKPE